MKCPFCSHEDTRVVDSRETKNGVAIRRRRECARCEGRFSTYEEPEAFQLSVVKRDGRKESYDRDKIKTGVLKAFEKRPNMTEKIGRVLGAVEERLQSLGVSQMTSREIGKIVMDVVRDIDEVAYLRFASVYKSFGSAKSFRREIDRIEEKPE
jgi:transcriptional repressor NrdR